jgi:ABC-2 type transport system ATP-binding protein
MPSRAAKTAIPAVQTTGLGKRFGRQWALAHCDLEVQPGEVLLLAGANGSGKTTLLRLIAGLYKPTQGSMSIYGMDPEQEKLACRRTLTLVGHDNYLYSQLSALEMLQVWTRLRGVELSEGQAIDLLREVDLHTLLRTRLEEPRLVLLDEPFSALDASGQNLIEEWIEGYRSAGKTVVLASHNLPRSSKLCDRAILLQQGQMLWQGTGADLLNQVGTTV